MLGWKEKPHEECFNLVHLHLQLFTMVATERLMPCLESMPAEWGMSAADEPVISDSEPYLLCNTQILKIDKFM